MSILLKKLRNKKKPEDDTSSNASSTGSSVSSRRATVEDFSQITLLGKGAFAQVMLVKRKDNEKMYAMKVIIKQNVLDSGRIQDLFSERSVMRRSKHPFIVHMAYSFQTEHKLFFVMEYLPGGDMDSYLKRMENKRFTEEQALLYAAEIYLALHYLHENDIIYRDLKPENILLDAQGHACLSDFGLAKDFGGCTSTDMDLRASSFVGSPYYVAPDVLKQRSYSNSVDWWAFGVLLFRMHTGSNPFKGQNIRAIFEAIMHERHSYVKYPHLQPVVKDLIDGLLAKTEAQRFTGAMTRSHPYFENINWEAVYRKEVAAPGWTGPPDLPYAPLPKETPIPPRITNTQQTVFKGFSYQGDSTG